MATISLANQILSGQLMDPRPIQANFADIATFINDECFTIDGSKALTSALTLSGAGTAAGHAVNKSQMDAANAAIIATASANKTTAANATAAVIATASANKVTAANATTAAISTAAGDASTKKAEAITAAASDASTKKTQAISAAATDATTKSNAALVSAKAYTDAKAHIETQFVQDIVGSVLTTTSTAQTFLTTGNIVNAKAGYYIVSVSLDVNIKTVGGYGLMDPFVAELYVDGNVHGSQIVWDHSPNANIGARQTLTKVWIIANPADTALFQVKVRQVGGTLGSYECDGAYHSFIQALFVG